MKARKESNTTPRRERRAFTHEFKREAVRLMHERQVQGVAVAQIGRDLDVEPDLLRGWARRLAAREGGLTAGRRR